MNKRQHIHKALKAAKPLLSRSKVHSVVAGKAAYLCWALEDSNSNGEISNLACEVTKKMIMDRLDSHITVRDWLITNVGFYEVKRAGEDAMQEYRHRWLDALIKEFSK